MLIEYTTTVQKALPEVWRMATDYDEFPNWQPATRTAKVNPNDPIRAGSMLYLEKMHPLGLTFINADLVEFQRNKLVEMKGIYGRFRFRRTTEFMSGGRETTIRDRLEMNPGFLYFWYTPWLRATLTRQMREEWKILKQTVEGKPS